MKKFKSIKKKIFNSFFGILSRGLSKFEKNKIKIKKEIIIQNLQSVGYNFRLNGEIFTIRAPRKIIIGNNVHIGNNIYISGEGGLIIGDNTHISRNVTIYTVNHNYNGTALPYDATTTYKPVAIAKNVWVGMNVSILPGVNIGEGAIIGMGAVVNRNVKAYEIVGNNSLSNLKYRDIKHYKLLNTQGQIGGINGRSLQSQEMKLFLPTYKENKNKKIIFVLGTGRSGSNSIANIINQNPSCKAFHEDIQQITRISTNLAYYPDKKNKLYNELNQIFETKIWNANNNQILVHSDQRFWNLIPYFKNYFPNSKFINLRRDVYSCVKSMYSRGWYTNEEYPILTTHDWSKYRLQANKLGVISNQTWEGFNSIMKCTWYWWFINDSITKELNKIDSKDILHIELDELNKNLNQLSKFINDDSFVYKEIISNKVQTNHLEKYNSIDKNELKIQIDQTLQLLKEK